MSAFPENVSINQSCEDTLQWLKQSLVGGGLRVLETFDLRAARYAASTCSCPYHGTEECDCQMIVLLVYGEDTAPVTLTLHGNDGQTSISMAEDPAQDTSSALHAAVERALSGFPDRQGL